MGATTWWAKNVVIDNSRHDVEKGRAYDHLTHRSVVSSMIKI